MEDIVIIGGGPAGLTAAIYVQRAGKHAIVLEGNAPGGQILNAANIQNYPSIKSISGVEFAQNLYEQATELGAEIRFVKVVGIELKNDIKIVKTNKESIETKVVILATGASNKKLGVDRESEFLGKGVSYCATCDGAFFKKKDVAVVGGGNTAFEDALFLSNYCNKVYLIHRKSSFRAEQKFVDEVKKKENVEFVLNSTISKLIGTKFLEEIEVTNANGESKNIKVSGLFVAVGQIPGNGAFENVVNLDNFGYVSADESCKTNVTGIFVAGDARTKQVRQLTTACSDGTTAAIAAINYLK